MTGGCDWRTLLRRSALAAASIVLSIPSSGESPYQVAIETHEVDGEAVTTQEAPSCCEAPSRLSALRALALKPGGGVLSVEPNSTGARVLIDGELFAGYLTDPGQQPSVWPIVGPSGHEMTRSLPLGPAKPAERNDHPHHRSLWFAHGEVNGHDFWHYRKDRESAPRIIHLAFRRQEMSGEEAVIETENAWMAGEDRVLSDLRTLRFGQLRADAEEPARYVDFAIRLIASEGEVTFGDTKEGSFAVRVPGAMKIDAGFGGRVLNDRGATDGDAWGRAASWVDYRGPLEPPGEGGEPAVGGIVVMSHPDSFRPQCRWHVRGYGLFGANPFGDADFPPGDPPQGATTLAEGEELSLRYRTVFYADSPEPARIRDWFDAFAAERL